MYFENELKSRQLKVTPQRMAILKEIDAYGHISVDEIYEKIRNYYPQTSLATIYKNITLLCDSGILREIKAPGYKQKYEINQDKHVHVMCDKCGKLEDLHIDYDKLQINCMQASGYDLHALSAIFIGICPVCQALYE